MAAVQTTFEATYTQADRVLARAEIDVDFLRSFGEQPFETLAAAGVDGSAFLKGLLGFPEATDRELVDVVRTRLGAAARAAGCGIAAEGCGIAVQGCGIAVNGCGIAK